MSKANTAHAVIRHWAEKTPNRIFLTQPHEGEVQEWTFAKAYDAAARLAQWFVDEGFARGERVALLSKNCAEWIITDIALQMAGLVLVPIYPTASTETIKYVVGHCGAKGFIAGRLDNPGVVDGVFTDELRTISMRYDSVPCQHDWQSVIDGSSPIDQPYEADEEETMTILYTSGSTGRPKGVEISYRAYAYASSTCTDIYEVTPDDRLLSYLPLAHVAERTAGVGPILYGGGTFFFVDKLDTFVDDLKRAEPTLFTSVPRLWVQFQAGIHRKMPPQKLQRLLRLPIIGRIVAKRIREQLGLNNARLYGSGSAPISPQTLRWYEQIGINISEGWGMTETGGLSCTNLPFRSERIGTIGQPIPGTEIRIADDGEVQLKSPGLMTGYHNMPEETAATYTEDGFLKTGDKGEWDESVQGFRITGRVKDQFKSAKGKYVSPVPIEAELAGNPLVEQVCVMGTGLRAPVGVVVLAPAAEAIDNKEVAASLDCTLNETNTKLEAHEKLGAIAVAPDAWTIENDCLTPTMKIKRDVIENQYLTQLAELGKTPVEWLRTNA